jgi:hypothetical protein
VKTHGDLVALILLICFRRFDVWSVVVLGLPLRHNESLYRLALIIFGDTASSRRSCVLISTISARYHTPLFSTYKLFGTGLLSCFRLRALRMCLRTTENKAGKGSPDPTAHSMASAVAKTKGSVTIEFLRIMACLQVSG